MPLNRAFIGREYSFDTPFEVGRELIRHFASAIGDNNPIYHDVEAAKAAGHPRSGGAADLPDHARLPARGRARSATPISAWITAWWCTVSRSSCCTGRSMRATRLIGRTKVTDIRDIGRNEAMVMETAVIAADGEQVATADHDDDLPRQRGQERGLSRGRSVTTTSRSAPRSPRRPTGSPAAQLVQYARRVRRLQHHPLERARRHGGRPARRHRPRHVHHGHRRPAGDRLGRRSGSGPRVRRALLVHGSGARRRHRHHADGQRRRRGEARRQAGLRRAHGPLRRRPRCSPRLAPSFSSPDPGTRAVVHGSPRPGRRLPDGPDGVSGPDRADRLFRRKVAHGEPAPHRFGHRTSQADDPPPASPRPAAASTARAVDPPSPRRAPTPSARSRSAPRRHAAPTSPATPPRQPVSRPPVPPPTCRPIPHRPQVTLTFNVAADHRTVTGHERVVFTPDRAVTRARLPALAERQRSSARGIPDRHEGLGRRTAGRPFRRRQRRARPGTQGTLLSLPLGALGRRPAHPSSPTWISRCGCRRPSSTGSDPTDVRPGGEPASRCSPGCRGSGWVRTPGAQHAGRDGRQRGRQHRRHGDRARPRTPCWPTAPPVPPVVGVRRPGAAGTSASSAARDVVVAAGRCQCRQRLGGDRLRAR